MGRVLDLVSQLLDTASGGLPVHIGKLLCGFLVAGSQKTREERGAGGVGCAVKVRCINCGQRKMGRTNSQDAMAPKKCLNKKRSLFHTMVDRCVAKDR